MIIRVVCLCLFTALPFVAQAQHFSAAPSAQQLQESPVLLVDIRQPHEWQETGVLPDALLLPFDTADAFMDALSPHLQPGQPVALICRTGNRSDRAARVMADRLNVPVIDVQGGIFRLLRDGFQPQTPTRAQGCAIC